MIVKIRNTTDLPMPKYAKDGDSGMDLCSAASFTLPANSWVVAPTGIHIELEPGYEAQVRPRSGLAASWGIWCNFGTVDNGYRGEIKVIMFNISNSNFSVKRGDRIAQLVIAPVARAEIVRVEELNDSERGTAGLGSTGLNETLV